MVKYPYNHRTVPTKQMIHPMMPLRVKADLKPQMAVLRFTGLDGGGNPIARMPKSARLAQSRVGAL